MQCLFTPLHFHAEWPFYALRCSARNGTSAGVLPASSDCGLGLLRIHEQADDASKRRLKSMWGVASFHLGACHHSNTQPGGPRREAARSPPRWPGSALLCPPAALHRVCHRSALLFSKAWLWALGSGPKGVGALSLPAHPNPHTLNLTQGRLWTQRHALLARRLFPPPGVTVPSLSRRKGAG